MCNLEWGTGQGRGSVGVAAAADLSTVIKEIGTGYEKKTGVRVNLSFGASGALRAANSEWGPVRSVFLG